jgi:hypothetical protein
VQTTQQKDLVPKLGTTEEDQALLASREYYKQLIDTIIGFFNRYIFFNQQKPAFEELQQDFESLAEFVLGKDIFQSSGYHYHPPSQGIFGQGEINNKVRISAINGLYNTPDDRQDRLTLLSKSHGGCNVHYIARAYEGTSRAMPSAFISWIGFLSEQSYTLATLWKKLIMEMGGVNGGGTIIHYAHSAGGCETYNAAELMTKEELNMIKVYTFGSPKMIPTGIFQSAVNYFTNDYICVLDVVSILKSFVSSNLHVIYIPLFGFAHELSSEPYRNTLERLGKEFTKIYLTAPDHIPAFVID